MNIFKTLQEISPNYELIEIKPNEWVVVDKKDKKQDNDYCVHFGKDFTNNILIDKNTLVKITDYYEDNNNVGFWKQEDKNTLYSYSDKDCSKIILASQSLNLDGVSVLELVDEVEVLAKNYKKIGIDADNPFKQSQLEKIAFIKGYNTHKQSADKKYSGEDLKKALKMAQKLKNIRDEHGEIIGSECFYSSNEIIQSLNNQKVLKVEVEQMYDINPEFKKEFEYLQKYQFKLTNGKVKGILE